MFLTLSLTGAEITNYTITRMRVSQLALHIADNASRIGTGSQLQAKTISESDINDLLTGAGLQAGSLDLYTRGRVIVSDLEPMSNPNTSGKFRIKWQRCRGAITTHKSSFGEQGDTDLDGIGNTNHKATAIDTGATMFVEVFYEYQPLIETSLSPSRTMIETASMMVRDKRDLTKIYNTENAPVSSC
ncbi:pilus assembly protein [Stakelama marina]|uniref:pilus assembly protein n=1 Tax=Stakelama marina TaxID=2826939 RepID=UPI0024C370EE|nr:pilus assembly protein [Stakelama marina]